MCLCPCISPKVFIYRSLIVFFLCIGIVDAILWYNRMVDVNQPLDPLLNNTQIYIGFIVDSIGSATGILPIALYVFSVGILLPIACLCGYCGDADSGKKLCQTFCQPAIIRFTTFNCNCPCYVTRPKSRFRHRILFLVGSSMLRISAVIIYVTAQITDENSPIDTVAILCGLSVVCPICTMLLDTYRYRIWWHYRPSCDDNRSCEKLSPKHLRFLPYHLMGDNRSMVVPGNQPCVDQTTCTNRELEHIMIFHSSEYKPQLRWRDLTRDERAQGIYVGFHRTSAEAAVSIAHSDFRISSSGKQMLGHGIYFARSISGTLGKARHGGATICAEIRMGKVKEITRSETHTVANSNRWWRKYDTVYLVHHNDNRDEFCVKDPSQVLRWVIIVDEEFDNNVKRFGLQYDFANTQCDCI